jgi:hypothetical protein
MLERRAPSGEAGGDSAASGLSLLQLSARQSSYVLDGYLMFFEPRPTAFHRVLKPTGTMDVHLTGCT